MDIESFSDEQLAGQRLMVGFDGIQLDQQLRFLIDTLRVGGIILFSRNLINPDQIKQLTRSIQHYAEACGQPPLFISIDQEGGQVARLKPPFTQFPGNPEMSGQGDAARFAEITASELAGVGINMNMAPVLDIAPEGIQSVMADRVFGHDPNRVSQLGITVIKGLQQRNIMSVAKHFPGIGRTILDSHLEMPDTDIDPRLVEQTDLVPFHAAIEHDVAGLMLSHIRYKKIDGKWPASLSAIIAKELLRDRMGFDGVVMTDDLDMGAIQNHYSIQTAIAQILAADIDVALICHQSPKIETAFHEIVAHLKSSGERMEKCLAAVKRIMDLKQKYLSHSTSHPGIDVVHKA